MKKNRTSLKRRLFPILLVVLCLLTLATLLYTGVIWPNSLFAAKYSIQGIDVSSYQKQVDWKSVAQANRYTFVFIKATEGSTYQDAYFQTNWRETKKQGLLRGAYHFYNVYSTGSEQAANYISIVPKEAGMLPPVLDLEVSGQDDTVMLREIKIFLDRLEAYYGLKPIIYADRTRYEEYIKGHFENYPIWIRDIVIPASWSTLKNWTFWQYDDRGHVPGIDSFVDFNAFSGGKSQLQALTSQSK